jgi:hypothetical protein
MGISKGASGLGMVDQRASISAPENAFLLQLIPLS